MDYGYRLLRHVVQQVFGNLAAAAQLTLLLFLIPFALFLWLTDGTGFAFASSGDPGAGSLAIGILVLLVLAVFSYCWAAVGWHRYVLLEERGNGVLPQWRPGQTMAYLGRAFLVILIVFGISIAAGIVIGIVTALFQSAAVALVLGIGLIFGATWVATRIGLVLPAAALGQKMGIGESWRATAPVSGQILLPLIVIALVTGILGQVIVVFFGDTQMVTQFGQSQEVVILSLPGQILNGIVSWLQILVNLALLTTLYGNLVEGRQLN